ncbi:hypothetical protein E2C01_082774 [Portunus trituberculatus]|uniref:Uncharacterized protein n=1 Tax=Portunus trituberculatus TaxID=210409 RepID=A0A5B7J614_PORTR|nr:hypothetical protein [Portunus trituberculatus]
MSRVKGPRSFHAAKMSKGSREELGGKCLEHPKCFQTTRASFARKSSNIWTLAQRREVWTGAIWRNNNFTWKRRSSHRKLRG